MNKLKTLTIIGSVFALIATASAVDFSANGLYDYKFDNHRNAGGVEFNAYTNLFVDPIGQTSLGLSQGYELNDKSNSIGLTSLALRQDINKLTFFGLAPYAEGRVTLAYGQGQKPTWTVAPTFGEKFTIKNVDLFASVGYGFGLEKASDSLTTRVGVNFSF